MRKLIIFTASSFLALGTMAGAQNSTAPAQTPPADQTAPVAPSIQSVNIVDFNELPAETQSQVSKIEKDRSPDEMQQMRSSIDATPSVASALESKGLTSANVVVASLNPDGALTLITRKAPG